MDDPISALDANVKKKIFQNVFMDALKDKTRVLVTHAVDFLHLVDKIIVLKDGEIVLQGGYEQIKEDAYLVKLMGIYKSHQTEQKDMVLKGAIDAKKKKDDELIEVNDPESDGENDIKDIEQLTKSHDPSMEMSICEDNDDSTLKKRRNSLKNKSRMVKKKDLEQDIKEKKTKGKITTDENEERINVNFHIWWTYFSKYYGLSFFICINMACWVMILSRVSADYLIGNWAFNEDQHTRFWFYASLSLVFASTSGFGVLLRALFA